MQGGDLIDRLGLVGTRFQAATPEFIKSHKIKFSEFALVLIPLLSRRSLGSVSVPHFEDFSTLQPSRTAIQGCFVFDGPRCPMICGVISWSLIIGHRASRELPVENEAALQYDPSGRRRPEDRRVLTRAPVCVRVLVFGVH